MEEKLQYRKRYELLQRLLMLLECDLESLLRYNTASGELLQLLKLMVEDIV